jgi:hypothetical protein
MSFSGDKKGVSPLTATEVEHPAVFPVEGIEKIDKLLERRSTNVVVLSV